MPVLTLAFKYVAAAVMLMEINHCASRLLLPVRLPLTTNDISGKIFPREGTNFIARVDTTNFSFSFARSGKLCFITRLEDGFQAYSTTRTQGDLRTSVFLRQLVAVKSIIDTNEAYRIATNWLTKIDVDVARLEREHRPRSWQQNLIGHGLIPVFHVDWGKFEDSDGPAVQVMIAGDTKDLLYLRQDNESYSRRPLSLIKDADQLLAISNDEFQKYSPVERSNLVIRFAAVDYSAAPMPTAESHKQKGENTSR